MVEKITLNDLATALVDIPAVSTQLHAPSKLETSVGLCCVTKLHILEWPFLAPSTNQIKSNVFITYTWLADVNVSVAKCLCF